MRSLRLRRTLRLATPLASVTLALVLYACGADRNSVEPELLGARTSASRVSLSVDGVGSKAGGVVTSNRGGISCTITVSGGVVNRSGKCAQDYKTGATITLIGSPAGGGVLSSWTGCTGASENPLSCEVKLDVPRTVSVAFGPPSTSYALTIAGGAGGNGKITSTPAGISCTITSGTAGSTGCTTNFAPGTSVTLSAIASTGSFVKAWAGAGCDAAGTGTGSSSGSCVVSMSAAQSVVVSFDLVSAISSTGQWSAPITWPAVAIHAHLLPDGRVLTWGRSDHLPVLWTPPATGTNGSFASISKPADLFCSGHAFLPDGRLLSAGGHSGIDNKGILTSTIFDFGSNTWVTGPSMQNGRWYPSNTTLATGEVLTLSGGDTAQTTNLIPEVYQSNGSWRVLSTASLYLPYFPMAFVTPTGNVFVAGPSQSTWFLDPSGTGHWTSGPSSHYGPRDYGSALMYDVGKIFLVGGGGPTASAEVIDLNAGAAASWRTVTATMAIARRQSNATLLADGKILVTGGTNATGFNGPPTSPDVLAAELWNPATEQFKTLARMTHYRLYHSTALLLSDGRVLSAGSGQPAAAGLSDDYTAEIFSPPYLFNADGTLATRPTITGAPTAVTYGQSFDVQTPASASVSKVMWISLASVTHSYNQNQHGQPLTFSVNGTSAITVASPARAALAPPGYYLLFVIDNRGVPSVARTVRIN